MKVAHARLARAQDEEILTVVATERRREPRVTTRFNAVLQMSDGVSNEVQLADVSAHGCCVRGDAEGLRIGRFVSIGLDEDSMLQAVIRWVRDGTAGMEFLRPIPPEQVEWHDLMEMPL